MDKGRGEGLKKIGIITHYYKSRNYGGNLQAYALSEFLKRKGWLAEQISVKNALYKVEVKKAVEAVFDVKVKDVNIINVRKKQRRMGRYEGFCPAVRKAVVTLEEGQSIPAFEI